MACGMDRLAEIAQLGFAIVPRPIEDVLPFYRGQYLDLNICNTHHRKRPPPLAMVTGDKARLAGQFGPYPAVPAEFEARLPGPTVERIRYMHSGTERLSRIDSKPEYTLIEGPCSQVPFPWWLLKLIGFLNAPYFLTFRSRIRDDDSTPNFFHEIMSGGERQRLVCARMDYERTRPRMVFESVGEPLEWENPDHCCKRLIRDRLNRNIICEYLEALGIDPEGMLLRRELSDVVLFCDDPEGEALDPYVDDYKAFIDFMDFDPEPPDWVKGLTGFVDPRES